MPNLVNDFWDSHKITHAGKKHGIYRLIDFLHLPNTPGIYSWHLNSTSLNFDSYFKAFKQKKVRIQVNGHLKEAYVGEVRNTYYDSDFVSPTIDHSLCEFASMVFSPPLYIGISKTLKSRLNTHLDELQKIYTGAIKLGPIAKIGQTDFDTIVESSHFAQRFGHSLVELKNFKLDEIYVKTVELPNTYSWSELQKVEKYINRTFTPIYGRK